MALPPQESGKRTPKRSCLYSIVLPAVFTVLGLLCLVSGIAVRADEEMPWLLFVAGGILMIVVSIALMLRVGVAVRLIKIAGGLLGVVGALYLLGFVIVDFLGPQEIWRSEAIAPSLAGMMYALTVLFGLVVLAGAAAMAINAIVSRTAEEGGNDDGQPYRGT